MLARHPPACLSSRHAVSVGWADEGFAGHFMNGSAKIVLATARSDRQSDLEGCAFARSVTVGAELSVVGLDDRLGDGQPDTASGAVDGARAVAPVEALEQLGSHIGVEAVAGVGHGDPASVVVSGGGDNDGAPFGRMTKGVV